MVKKKAIKELRVPEIPESRLAAAASELTSHRVWTDPRIAPAYDCNTDANMPLHYLELRF